MAPIVRPPCNLAGRQAQVCRRRAGHPARAGRAAGPQSRTSEAPPDGRALGKGPGAAAGALLFSAGKRLAPFPGGGATRDGAALALRAERGLPFALGLAPLRRRTSGSLLRGQPVEAGGSDLMHFLLVEEADAAADHAEDAAGEERPGLGVGVSARGEDTFLLAAADDAGDEVVHLTHVAAEL